MSDISKQNSGDNHEWQGVEYTDASCAFYYVIKSFCHLGGTVCLVLTCLLHSHLVCRYLVNKNKNNSLVVLFLSHFHLTS